MSEFAEYHVEKVPSPPLVHDATHPDETDDDAGAEGALVALAGAPIPGGVPTFDSGTGKHTSQIPTGAMTPTYIAPDETFTVPANRQTFFAAPIDIEGGLLIDGAFIEVD